jgi:L-2-amino-thiazoline-4-carboxylic acid hydrolase
MSLKMRILSCWTPKWFLKRGLNELAHSTINGLEEVLIKQDPEYRKDPEGLKYSSNILLKGNLQEQRMSMAAIHNELVETMIDAFGHDDAIILGRKAMFREGLALGRKFRRILGVGTSLEDLISAASILYEVLGIEFDIKAFNSNKIVMVVNHCALAEYYGPDTCNVLSAADEGVVQGLNSKIKMEFQERISEGASCCLAPIHMEDDKK